MDVGSLTFTAHSLKNLNAEKISRLVVLDFILTEDTYEKIVLLIILLSVKIVSRTLSVAEAQVLQSL